MMNINHRYKTSHKRAVITIVCGLVMILLSFSAYSQEHPPRPMQVSTFQNLSFGAFIPGPGLGKVIIDPQGSRSVTGGIIPFSSMGFPYYPAIFEISAIPGTLINIVFGPDVVLTGNNGGTLLLHVDTSLPNSPFINTKSTNTQVRIGGTLNVNNIATNPAGNYIGTFSVTFVQQ